MNSLVWRISTNMDVFYIHWKVNAFWRGDYTSLWKIVFTQVGADCNCYGLVSCFFKDFKAFLAAPLLLFKLNWPKRHLYGLSHSESLLQIVRIAVFRSFSLLRFFSLGRYLNKVTSPDCDEDCWERFFWDSHWHSLAAAAGLLGGIHRIYSPLNLRFHRFFLLTHTLELLVACWEEFTEMVEFSPWISQIFEEDIRRGKCPCSPQSCPFLFFFNFSLTFTFSNCPFILLLIQLRIRITEAFHMLLTRRRIEEKAQVIRTRIEAEWAPAPAFTEGSAPFVAKFHAGPASPQPSPLLALILAWYCVAPCRSVR